MLFAQSSLRASRITTSKTRLQGSKRLQVFESTEEERQITIEVELISRPVTSKEMSKRAPAGLLPVLLPRAAGLQLLGDGPVGRTAPRPAGVENPAAPFPVKSASVGKSDCQQGSASVLPSWRPSETLRWLHLDGGRKGRPQRAPAAPSAPSPLRTPFDPPLGDYDPRPPARPSAVMGAWRGLGRDGVGRTRSGGGWGGALSPRRLFLFQGDEYRGN